MAKTAKPLDVSFYGQQSNFQCPGQHLSLTNQDHFPDLSVTKLQFGDFISKLAELHSDAMENKFAVEITCILLCTVHNIWLHSLHDTFLNWTTLWNIYLYFRVILKCAISTTINAYTTAARCLFILYWSTFKPFVSLRLEVQIMHICMYYEMTF